MIWTILEVTRGAYLIESSVESSINEVLAVHFDSHMSNISISAGQYSSLFNRTISPIYKLPHVTFSRISMLSFPSKVAF